MKKPLLFGLFVLLAAILVNLPVFRQLRSVGRRLDFLEAEAVSLRESGSRLREEIARLDEDPLHVERTARLELGLVREGEWVIRER